MIEVHGSEEQLPSLFAALSKALAEIGPVTKDNTATARGGRQYSYADLTAVLDAIRPVLHTHDLWYSQNPGQIREVGNILVQTIDSIIGHGGGAYILYRTDIPMSQQTEQGMGIGTSYGRRYQAVGNWAVGMEDNDAQHTTAPRNNEPPRSSSESTGASRGHMAQAAMELGAIPVGHVTAAALDGLRLTTNYPSNGIIGAYLNNGNTPETYRPEAVTQWAEANPGADGMVLLRAAAEYAVENFGDGPLKLKTKQWLEENR